MVDLANRLQGWTQSVYRFGCGFIHLSGLHDYRSRDALLQLEDEEREAVIRHLRFYHGGPSRDAPTFVDIEPLLPMVFEKIAGNLECYVKQLEEDKEIDQL
jgi:hypothetical protein